MKKKLSIVLVAIMVLSVCISSLAYSSESVLCGEKTYTVSTNGIIKTAEDTENGIKVSYNSLTGVLVVSEDNGAETTSINIRMFSTDDYKIEPSKDDSNSSHDNEYAYWCTNKYIGGRPYKLWQLQIPNKVKLTYQEIVNSHEILSFVSCVNDLCACERAIYLKGGQSALNTALNIISTFHSGLWGLIATVLFGASASDVLENMFGISNAKKDCNKYFNDVIVFSKPIS